MEWKMGMGEMGMGWILLGLGKLFFRFYLS